VGCQRQPVWSHGTFPLYVRTLTLFKDNQWVAVKVITSDRTGNSRELASHRALAKHSRGLVEDVPLIHLLDDFLHTGVNGQHQCLVFELLGPSVNLVLAGFRETDDLFVTKEIFTISTRLLQAVAFLHSVGYAHGGAYT